MVGTKAGSIKTQATLKKKYGIEGYKAFFQRIGQKGGQNGHTGGFASDPELARRAGQKGGRISRRTGVKNGEGKSKASERRYND